MKRLTLKIFIAAATFLIGMAVVSRWHAHRSSRIEKVIVAAPDMASSKSSVSSRDFAEDIKPSGIKLLTTGQFHSDEVMAKTGERWLGLYPNGNGYGLIFSTLTVRRVHDEVVDGESGAKTGKSVEVNHRETPVFLLKGARMLHPGFVVTLFTSSEKTLGNKSVIDFHLAGADYHLSVVSDDPNPDDYVVPQSARLVLTSGATSQVLFPSSDDEEIMNEPSIYLYWAGDLDGDEKLDLYMHLNAHYNVSRAVLFLSSQARSGQLVRAVAAFSSGGC